MKKTPLILFVTVVALGLIGFTLGCRKSKNNIDNQNVDATVGQISGQIKLPLGISLDISTLSVNSPIDNGIVTNGNFSIKGFVNMLNTTIVTYANGNAAMMGYYIPESKDSIISTKTTALALAMNTPAALSLSPDAKEELAKKIFADPKIVAVENVITANLSTQRDLFDTTNEELQITLKELFESAAFKTSGNSPTGSPITFNNSGTMFTFYNGENIFSTAIGIYKDGKRIKNILLEGEEVFPTSIVELLNGKGSIINGANPYNSSSYTLTGEAQYELKIRTGFPGNDDGSIEYQEALKANAISLTFKLLESFLPFINKENEHCIANIATTLYSGFENMTKSGNIAAFFATACFAANDERETLISCFGPDKALNGKYFKLLGKAFTFFDKGASLIGESLNIGFFLRQWSITPPFFDTCFLVSGNDIAECDNIIIGKWTLRDYNVYDDVEDLVETNTNTMGSMRYIEFTTDKVYTDKLFYIWNTELNFGYYTVHDVSDYVYNKKTKILDVPMGALAVIRDNTLTPREINWTKRVVEKLNEHELEINLEGTDFDGSFARVRFVFTK